MAILPTNCGSALAIKYGHTVRCREQAILYSHIGAVGMPSTRVVQLNGASAISRRPDIRKTAVIRRNSRGGNRFV